jgi:hypothetical protein
MMDVAASSRWDDEIYMKRKDERSKGLYSPARLPEGSLVWLVPYPKAACL